MVVRNLATHMTEERLTKVFSQYGVVRSVRLTTDIMTGRCRGIGFVRLDEQEAGVALTALNGSSVGGRVLHVALEQKASRA